MYLATTVTCIKNVGFRELKLKFSKKVLTLKIKFRQGTDGAYMSLHNEDIS